MGNTTPDANEGPEICPDGARGYYLNLNQHAPLDWAVPMYGYVMPMLVIFTTTTNLFIMIVLSQKHLRTPTNLILLSMALTDLLTGWTSIPWFVYYYTLGGYNAYDKIGLTEGWCKSHQMLHNIFPSLFHTTTMWLTVFLAIQRYVYVCVPNSIQQFCTPKNTKTFILCIFLGCASLYLAEFFGHYRMVAPYIKDGVTISGCFHCTSKSLNNAMTVYLNIEPLLRATIHFTPCILLAVYTRKLALTITAAEVRKRSWATESMFDRRGSSISPRCSATSSGRSMYATNRMLAVICTVFFLLEIPAGLLYLYQIVDYIYPLPEGMVNVDLINKFIILRTLAIIISSPIQFFIYCSMSEQFRLTARQLFTSRLLFVAQAQATFHGGKRYSLILVDVETFEAKRKQSAARRGLLAKASNAFMDRTGNSSTLLLPLPCDGPPTTTIPNPAPKRKVGRQARVSMQSNKAIQTESAFCYVQVSFPDEDPHERDRLHGLSRGQLSLRTTLRRTSLTRAFRRASKTVDEPAVMESAFTDDSSIPMQPITTENGLTIL